MKLKTDEYGVVKPIVAAVINHSYVDESEKRRNADGEEFFRVRAQVMNVEGRHHVPEEGNIHIYISEKSAEEIYFGNYVVMIGPISHYSEIRENELIDIFEAKSIAPVMSLESIGL